MGRGMREERGEVEVEVRGSRGCREEIMVEEGVG